jgi:hypothetical protein
LLIRTYFKIKKKKEKRAAELAVANTELAFQNEEKENQTAELIIANKTTKMTRRRKSDS